MKDIRSYTNSEGRTPFNEWMQSLDKQSQARIDAYIQRVAMGAAKKNTKAVGKAVFEIKINSGPGYRVYFGEVGRRMILLLIGGDKSTQSRDIIRAQEFWRDYNAED